MGSSSRCFLCGYLWLPLGCSWSTAANGTPPLPPRARPECAAAGVLAHLRCPATLCVEAWAGRQRPTRGTLRSPFRRLLLPA